MARFIGVLCCTLLLTSCGGAPAPEQPVPTDSRKIADIDPDFAKDVLQSKVPVLVDFWAPWCGPCRVVAPILEELAKENDGKFKLVKVNVDDKAALADYYGIQTIPTLILVKNGAAHRRLRGVPQDDPQKGDTKTQLSNWLKSSLAD